MPEKYMKDAVSHFNSNELAKKIPLQKFVSDVFLVTLLKAKKRLEELGINQYQEGGESEFLGRLERKVISVQSNG